MFQPDDIVRVCRYLDGYDGSYHGGYDLDEVGIVVGTDSSDHQHTVFVDFPHKTHYFVRIEELEKIGTRIPDGTDVMTREGELGTVRRVRDGYYIVRLRNTGTETRKRFESLVVASHTFATEPGLF